MKCEYCEIEATKGNYKEKPFLCETHFEFVAKLIEAETIIKSYENGRNFEQRA